MDDNFDDYAEPDVHPSIRRAHELLARVDETLARPRPEPATMWRAPEPKPIPETKAAPMNQAAIDRALADERRIARVHLEKRLQEFAAMIGEETGRAQKELRAEFERKLELVQAAQRMALGEVKADLETREPWGPRRKATAPRRNGHAGAH